VPYAFITFAQAQSILASRLEDAGLTFWNQPNELANSIIEAVRTFQALTGSYKQQFGFFTTPFVPYYDLTQLPASPINFNVTDVEVANNVLAALLEPPLTAAWVGTGQFTFTQLLNALQSRVNRYLGDTGAIVTEQTLANAGALETIAVPDPVLDVRRAAWQIPGPGSPPTLAFSIGMTDEWAEQAYVPDRTPTQPTNFAIFVDQPQQMRFIPPPAAAGSVECLFVKSGPTVSLNPASPVILPIPDDLTPAIKWGVISDLLSGDGLDRDPARAQYAEQRYREFVQTCWIYPSVLLPSQCGIPIGIGSVFDLDSYTPEWEQIPGPPGFIGMCGRNMACVGPTPDGQYSIGLWISVNAPVLNGPLSFIQLSRDQIDPMLDMAQHIASFKMGGQEFTMSDKLYQNFIQSATAQNARLNAISFWRSQIEQPHDKSEMQVPRMLRVDQYPYGER